MMLKYLQKVNCAYISTTKVNVGHVMKPAATNRWIRKGAMNIFTSDAEGKFYEYTTGNVSILMQVMK